MAQNGKGVGEAQNCHGDQFHNFLEGASFDSVLFIAGNLLHFYFSLAVLTPAATALV
jgi:hypothetical protein